jgi:hypothetical protein
MAVGDSYQGGKIGYILQSGDPGYSAGQTHGLIVNSVDLSTSEWGCSGGGCSGSAITSGNGADSQLIGDGQANTTAIVTDCATATAPARQCDNLSSGGYSDWFLPSKNELTKIYPNRTIVGGFSGTWYWSSSEDSAGTAWELYFPTNTWVAACKSAVYSTRCIRTF